MRLNNQQVETIVQAMKKRFHAGAHIYLFGSRVDDVARGGDIDLFVDLPEQDQEMVRHSCQVIADIQRILGEQKIDLIVRHPESIDQPIFHEALRSGVLLA